MKFAEFAKSPFPDEPGVYLFKGLSGKILYIGKATSLRDRVRSYFNKDLLVARGSLLVEMIEKARMVDYIQTDSVLEALILEASLIKNHCPVYNTRDKDDKSYNYLVITREGYPRVLLVRGKDLDEVFRPRDIKYVFGPFPHGGLLREAIKIVRKIFPFRDKCLPAGQAGRPLGPTVAFKGKPCFNAQIGLCPGVCDGRITKVEYGRMINHIRLFFEGKKSALLRQLRREMEVYVKAEEFEEAEDVKRQLFALTHIQDVTLLKREIRDLSRARGVFRIEAYDVAHIGGTYTTGVMVVVEEGEVKKSDYRKFRIHGAAAGNDTAALREMLDRRFMHTEWRLPNMVVVDGGKAQLHAAEIVLQDFGYRISVVSVVKNEYHKPREILGEKGFVHEHERAILLGNGEAHRFAIGYHRKLRSKSQFR